MPLIAGNGGVTPIVVTPEEIVIGVGEESVIVTTEEIVEKEFAITKTRLKSTSYYFVKDGREVLIVREEEFDVTDVPIETLPTLMLARTMYVNNPDFYDKISFGVFLYKVYELPIYYYSDPYEEEVFEELEIDVESLAFKFELWKVNFITKLKASWNTFKWIGIPIIVVGTVLIVGLIGYTYAKTYITQKAIKKVGT